MTPEEWAAQAASAKREYEREIGDLVAQLERTRAKLTRLEKRLATIDDIYRAKMAQLGASLLGLPGPELTVPAVIAPLAVKRPPGERKRGALDEPLLALAREIASPDVTSRQIEEVWNQRNPDHQIRDSTVRSILDWLEAKGAIQTSQMGGGKGSGIPRKYRPSAE